MSEYKYPQVIVAARRNGKTTKALEWLEGAKRVGQYPFWDRVLLVKDLIEAQKLRTQLRERAKERDVPDSGLFYNLVYSWDEWRRAHLGRGWRGEIAVDDAEFIIADYFDRMPSLVAMSGEAYKEH